MAIAGPSRSGKGTVAEAFSSMAREAGYTYLERQLSGPGKHHLARIFNPEITEQEAIKWFEELKYLNDTRVNVTSVDEQDVRYVESDVSLREFVQHGLQEGARNLWGDNFWTNMLLPEGSTYLTDGRPFSRWWRSFDLSGVLGVDVADLCLISDLRQPNEAKRVRDLGGVVIEVRRFDSVVGSDHVTDQRLPVTVVDAVINNDSDLHGLETGASRCFEDVVLPLLKEG